MINWSKVCEVGLKIAVTAITGVVAYFGISKAIKNNNIPPQQPRNSEVGNNYQQPGGEQPIQQQPRQDTSNNISNSFRQAQNTFAKLGNVVGNIATLAETIGSLFRKDNPQPYYNESWKNDCGKGYRRVSDFIMVFPDENGRYDNCCL